MTVDTDSIIRALASVPERLKKSSRGADVDALARRPSADEWSAAEIVAHLRANADVWGSSIRRMLDEDQPNIRYVSPRAAMRKPEYSERGFTDGLRLFAAQRHRLVDTLKMLPTTAWSRAATFTGTSRTHQTVFDYAQRIAAHEAEHVVQLEALFSA